MAHKPISVEFLDGTALAVTFQNGKTKKFDIKTLFSQYPQMKALKDRELFLSGRLVKSYGIIWNAEQLAIIGDAQKEVTTIAIKKSAITFEYVCSWIATATFKLNAGVLSNL